jgi:ketosteroid isomerase-like protein
VRDGKLVELVEYLDTALLMRVLPTVEPATPTS